MKHPMLHNIWLLFKAYFLPQPSHDEQFPQPEKPAASSPNNSAAAPATPEQPAPPKLESAEEMERRASRENARNLNLHEEDLSNLAKSPEDSDARASRDSNPFSRSSSE